MRYVFISDVHGQFDKMISALNEVKFDKDKDTDQWTDKPIDDFCHLIDAARYATQCGTQRKQLQTLDKTRLGL